jgi:hypothetical protein
MNNRKASSGRFTNSGFVETRKTTFVGGKTYSERLSQSNKHILIMVVFLVMTFILLYNFVPDFKYVVDLFI